MELLVTYSRIGMKCIIMINCIFVQGSWKEQLRQRFSNMRRPTRDSTTMATDQNTQLNHGASTSQTETGNIDDEPMVLSAIILLY